MTEAECVDFKTSVKKTLTRLKKELDDLEQTLQPIAPECALGTLTRFELMQDQVRIHTTYLSVKKHFNALSYTYEHVNDEDFGLCYRCKNPIPIQRILLVPHNKFCVRCAS